jgi:hypothetical protein
MLPGGPRGGRHASKYRMGDLLGGEPSLEALKAAQEG